MVRLSNRCLQEEEHREAQGGTLLGEIGGWVALECDCRAKLVLDAESADRPSRYLRACGVCGKRFARGETSPKKPRRIAGIGVAENLAENDSL